MLTRIALRIAVQEALRGRTLAGNNVLDSQIGALDLDADGSLRSDQERPFLAIYTDGGSIGGGFGLALFGEPTVELVIEAGISAAMVEENKATGETTIVGLGLPATDDIIELSLDLMMRQVADALTDPDNEWAELVRQMLQSVAGIDRARVGQVANGTRLAAHELRIRAGLLEDPVKGALLADTVYAQFLAALSAANNPRLAAIKSAFEDALAGAAMDWSLVQRLMGFSNAQSLALGKGDAPGEPLSDVVIEVEGGA